MDTVVRTLSQNWWLVLLQGVLSVVLGVLALARPGVTLAVLVVLWGLFALLNGVVDVFAAIGAAGNILSTVGNISQQLLQEQVANRIQLLVMRQANALDLVFFERPQFYDPPGRGFELPGTGSMSEDFDAKLQNPPPGVQVWSSCIKGQQSIELESGSAFMQALCAVAQERLPGIQEASSPLYVSPLR